MKSAIIKIALTILGYVGLLVLVVNFADTNWLNKTGFLLVMFVPVCVMILAFTQEIRKIREQQTLAFARLNPNSVKFLPDRLQRLVNQTD